MTARQITPELAAWTGQLSFSDIPSAVIEKAKLQVASVLAAVLEGSITPAARGVQRAVTEWDGGARATLLPSGKRLSHHGALYANAAASVVHDFDDYLFAGHTGHSAVLASLALAERYGGSGRDILAAQVAANETAGRIGASMLFGPHNGQMWSYIHLMGGAVAAAKLLRLDSERLCHAIGLAFSQPTYPLVPAFFGPDSKALIASVPAVSGVQAAELAAEGLTGARDILGDPQGFLRRYAKMPLDFVFSGYGSAWLTESLTFKIYPGCAYIDTAVDAAARILEAFEEKHGRRLEAKEVRSVRVKASLFTVGMEAMCAMYTDRSALSPIAINFSVALSLALFLLDGTLRPDSFVPERLSRQREEILAIADRVSLEHEMDFSRAVGGLESVGIDTRSILGEVREASTGLGSDLGIDPSLAAAILDRPGPKGERTGKVDAAAPTLEGVSFEKFRMAFPAEVTITTEGGEEYIERADVPLGGAGRPNEETAALVRRKFLESAAPLLGEAAARSALGQIENLESLESIGGLIEALCEPFCSR